MHTYQEVQVGLEDSAVGILILNLLSFIVLQQRMLLLWGMLATPLWEGIQPILHESSKTCEGPPEYLNEGTA